MLDDSSALDVAVLVSGGLDSAVLTVDLLNQFERVFPIYVRFGLRWEGTERAGLEAFLAGVSNSQPGIQPLTILDEPIEQVYGDHWSNAGQPGVPDANTEDSEVYLPGRNLLLAAKSSVWCRLRGIETLAHGTLRGNPFPDSTPEFFLALERVVNTAMSGNLRIIRPYERFPKTEVLRRGADLPLHLTFSCLDPIDGRHCGDCNKCAERQNAFLQADLVDRTEYATSARPRTSTEQDVCIE